jgi:uncharacterized protein (TIGR03437 family)
MSRAMKFAIASSILLFAVSSLLFNARSSTASGQCDQGPANPPNSATNDLDHNAADWGVFCEGAPLWVKDNVAAPSLDGRALRCALTGSAPGAPSGYSNVHCYRNLTPEPDATVFALSLSFQFRPTTTFNSDNSIVQALEFTMNKWQQGKRYEFALQWMNVGPGGPQWRYWDPHRADQWVSLGISDQLAGETWHTLTLEGEISNGQVYYRRFKIDGRCHPLDITVAPALTPGEADRLAVAVQLDGNAQASPYALYLDQVAFVRQPGTAPAPCGLLGGTVIDAMGSAPDWRTLTGGEAVSATLMTVAGCQGQAVQLNYNLGATKGAWAQLRRDFNPPLDLSAFDHLRFLHRGTARNTIEIGLVSTDNRNYFGSSWNESTGTPGCAYATWDLQDFRNDGQPFPDLRQVKAIFISVTNSADGAGGSGSFLVDELQGVNIAGRSVPVSYDQLSPNALAVQRAAAWVAARRQAGGFLKSWQEEPVDYAWLYDQALGLIVLSNTDPALAAQLAVKIRSVQNADGSWFDGYRFLTDERINTNKPAETDKPIGAISWMVYALTRYYLKSGDTAAVASAQRGAGWLATQQRADGSLSSSAEANLDGWWAFQATGYQAQADRLRVFLLSRLWDDCLGRFKSDANQYQIFLDNQTWGAAFLRAIGRDRDARRALSYARWTLGVTSMSTPSGDVCGFDGAGPFGVWNEGVLQYVAARGANSQFYWNEVARQQATDGGIANSPRASEFRAYIVWLSPWHGVAPTAWFYFAATGAAFPVSLTSVSSANYAGPQLAADSIASAFGQDLADNVVAASTIPLPEILGGAQVTLRDSAGALLQAPLFFVSPNQINFHLPRNVATGQAELRVARGGVIVTLGQIEIVRVRPGLFTANASGQGVAAALALRVRADGAQQFEPVSRFDPAQNRFVPTPIDLGPASDQVFLILFGTGTRFRSSLSTVSTRIGGVDAPVLFVGAQGDFVGLDQINLQIPRSLSGRGEVEIRLMADGQQANAVTINVK